MITSVPPTYFLPHCSTLSMCLVFVDNMSEKFILNGYNSAPYQAIFKAACKANIAQQIADGEFSQADAMAANVEDGVTNVRWPDEVLDALSGAWDEVIAEEVANNEDSARIWASITEFRENFEIWGEMGYLK